jgi:hypothetical protein
LRSFYGSGTTSGFASVAVGNEALYQQSTGGFNSALGYQAGYTNSTGTDNLYLGRVSGFNATTSSNTFVGADSGFSITSGAKNTILGRYNGNQSGVDIRTLSNYIVLSDGDGYPAFWGSGGASGYMRLQAGRLEFPATQNASSDPNTLDDYEEGTWTPALSRLGSAPSLTYTTQTGTYTKVGNMVTVTGTVTINAITSAGSTFNVLTGLPFSAGTTGCNGGLTCLVSSAVLVDPVLVFAPFNTEFRMRTLPLILTGGAMQVDYVAGGTFTFSGSYLI